MNVSMQDGFNLGWKLAAVLRGRRARDPAHLLGRAPGGRPRADRLRPRLRPDVQRRPRRPAEPEATASIPRSSRATSSSRAASPRAPRRATALRSSRPAEHQGLAAGFAVGMRFHSAPVLRLADARPMHLGHALKADGRWRLLAFADATDPGAPLRPAPPVRLPRRRPAVAAAALHAGRRGPGRGDRPSRRLAAGASRSSAWARCRPAAAAQGPLRADRLREAVLPGPRRRPTSSTCAGSTAAAAAWSSCDPTSMWHTSCRSTPTPSWRPSSMGSCCPRAPVRAADADGRGNGDRRAVAPTPSRQAFCSRISVASFSGESGADKYL